MTAVRNLHACILCQVQHSKNGLILHFSLHIFYIMSFPIETFFSSQWYYSVTRAIELISSKPDIGSLLSLFLQAGLSFPRWKKFLTLKGRHNIRSHGFKQFGPHLHHNVSIRWTASSQLHLSMSSGLLRGMLRVPSAKESHLVGPWRQAFSAVAPVLWDIIPSR